MTTDEQLLAADRQARRDALDIEQSFIVQAPAGSGKTELLIQRYLCLLSTVEHPEEILAITFTRKAAAEMRLRILSALQRARKGDAPGEDHLRITHQAALDVLARDDSSGWQLIENPRRMRIQTLDSLNASITRMQPLTSPGATSGQAIVDEVLIKNLCRKAAAATFDYLGAGGIVGDATRDVLSHVDNNTGVYITYLARMLRTRDQWLPFVGHGQLNAADAEYLRRRFEENLARIVNRHIETLRHAAPAGCEAAMLDLAAYAADNLGIDFDADPQSAECWSQVASTLLKDDGNPRQRVDKRHGFPPDNKDRKQELADLLASLDGCDAFLNLLHGVRDLPPSRYADEQWSVLVSLFRLLPVAAAELRRICIANGVTDHIDVAISAEKALGSPDEPGDVALLLDYQIRHILVDEMQDTSKAQYRMLEALTAGWTPDDKRTLFCVGDPMQSIYRFRNAEVAQFLLARDNGIGAIRLEPLVLRRNFRSGAGLVDWFNEVFPQVMAPVDDPASGAVAYSEATAADALQGFGECHVYPLFGGSKSVEARRGCRIIRDTLAKHPDDNMAVLVRSRTQLPELLSQLRDDGIAYQAVDIDRLTDLPEIIDLLALTRALVHGGDRIAWLALLRSPWVGLDWTDLHALVAGQRYATVIELLDEARTQGLSEFGQAAVARFRPLIEAALRTDRSMRLHRRVESAWLQLGGPAMLKDAAAIANAYHFLDVLARLEVGGTLADVAQLESELDAEHVSAMAPARLQVMTMHKAKGLEFDHVLLYGLGRYPSAGRKVVMNWLDLPDEHGHEDKIVSPVGRQDEVERDPLYRYIDRTRRDKDQFEQARLLYVACTRARRSLHLLGNTAVAADGSEMRPPYASSLLRLLWPAVEQQYAAVFEPGDVHIDKADDAPWIMPPLRRFATPWQLPDAPGVPFSRATPEAAAPAAEIEYDWAGRDARLAGTVVHRWLFLAVKHQADLGDTQAVRARSRTWLLEQGAPEATVEATCDRVMAALKGMLADERGAWLLSGEGDAELELNGVEGGIARKVIIDRVRIDDNGVHWVVDYKTSTHEGGNRQHFLEEETRRYREQLERYARFYAEYAQKDVRCALYFPLLQEFVEVSPDA